MAKDPVLNKLIQYLSYISYEKLPVDVVHEAKRRMLDTIGCAIAALDAPPVKAALSFARKWHASGNASILGTCLRSTPDIAAFVNGTMIRYLDFNDTYLSKEPAHPSDNISALLAVCEAEGVSGENLITALVLAYEIQCRFCDAASLRTHGWDHVSYGPISTSILASFILKLSPEEAEHAIAIATIPNLALRQTRAGEISHWKASAFANSARNGIFSAYLAQAGMEGASNPFCGVFGFATLVTGTIEFGDFGGENNAGFKIIDSSIKYFPVEYHAQSAIHLAIELGKNIDDPSNIEEISIFTFKTAIEIIGSGKEKWNPQNRETADHSLPYCVAAALMYGTIDSDSFLDARLKQLQPLLQKVKVIEDEEYNKLYPVANPTRIKIKMKNGQILEKELIYPKGHAKNPMTDEEVFEKFRRLTPYSQKKKEEIITLIMNLENEKIEDITAALNLN